VWIWIFLLALISVYNTVYGFLPDKWQKKRWIKGCGIVAASVILVYGLVEMISTYTNASYAYVSPDGTITKSHNFAWKIVTSTTDGFPIYTIDQRYGDSSDIEVIPEGKVPVETYLTIHGVAVKFLCHKEAVPRFKIRIRQ